MAKIGRLETIFTDNICLYIQPLRRIWPAKKSKSAKTQNKGYYAVQGHPRSSKVIEVGTNRKPVCDFLLVINSRPKLTSYFVPSRRYRSLLFKFWTPCVFEPPFGGLRNNVRCSSWAHWKARSGFNISVN